MKQVTWANACIIVVLLSLLLPGLILATEWQLAEEKDGISVYLREVEGSEIREFKGIIKIKTSLASLVGIWDDTEACPRWFHQCKSPLIVERLSFKEQFNYQVSDFPFPATDRDIISHMTLSTDPTNQVFTITIEAAPNYCQNKSLATCKKINNSGLVHMVKSNGYLRFQALGSGETEVTWQQHIEPGGKLPHWLINALVVDFPLKTFQRLRKVVKEEKYQKVKLRFGAEGAVLGLDGVSW